MLGGDCTVGVGTVAGLTRRSDRAALVYFDRHADLNVPASTDEGALDWMGVAHMLGVDGAVGALAGITGAPPMLTSDRLVFLGLGPQSPFEASQIADRGLPAVDAPRRRRRLDDAAPRRRAGPRAGARLTRHIPSRDASEPRADRDDPRGQSAPPR